MQCPVVADDAQQLCSERAGVVICCALRRCQSARAEEKSQAREPTGRLVHRRHAGSGPRSSLHARGGATDARFVWCTRREKTGDMRDTSRAKCPYNHRPALSQNTRRWCSRRPCFVQLQVATPRRGVPNWPCSFGRTVTHEVGRWPCSEPSVRYGTASHCSGAVRMCVSTVLCLAPRSRAHWLGIR